MRLAKGANVCAIPYSLASDGDFAKIVADVRSVLGVDDVIQIPNTAVLTKMMSHYDVGEMAILLTRSQVKIDGEFLGHATLMLRTKDGFVHINNQNWPHKYIVNNLSLWEKTFKRAMGPVEPYNVIKISSKASGR